MNVEGADKNGVRKETGSNGVRHVLKRGQACIIVLL